MPAKKELCTPPGMLKIKIKYVDPICVVEQHGDRIDLKSRVDKTLAAGEYFLIPLGVCMQLPEGYEAEITPRSSSFKHFGFIQTNSPSCIDEAYCGDNDEWFLPVYALKKGTIHRGDRVCQFRLVKKMETVQLEEVKKLGNPDRGGHGSSGK